MKKELNKYLKGFLPLFVLLGLWSCKKEISEIGVGLRPDGGNINGVQVFIDDIITRTIAEDSLRTDSLSTNILGAINDPIFGESRASLIVQPKMKEVGYDFTSAVLDSLILTLKFDRSQFINGVEQLLVYGNLDDALEIDVYKVAEELIPSNKYYSNNAIALGDKIGTYSGRFYFHDSVEVVIDGDTQMTAPELRIRLDDAFGNEMLSQTSSVYSSQDAFLEYLKGIALVPRMNQQIGKGVIAGFELDQSKAGMKLYYDAGEVKEFIFSTSSEHIGLYDFASPNPDIISQKSGSGHYNTTYVQAMGGSKVKIDIPGLDSIIEKGEQLVINEAKITVKVDVSAIDAYHNVPYRMLLLIPDPEDGYNYPIIDYIDQIAPPNIDWLANTNYGGYYESSVGGYTFHFNRHLQSLIEEYNRTGENTFDGFYLLIPSDFPITPARAVLNTDINNKGIEVSVTYTKLN